MALEQDNTDPEQPDSEQPSRLRKLFEAGGGIMPAEARPEEIPPGRPGRQGDPNAPGGPAPDPSSFRLSPTNPARGVQLAMGTPITPTGTGDGGWNERPFGPNVYRPPAADRGPSGWGQPWWPIKSAEQYPGVAPGMNMPNPMESYSVGQNASSQLARTAPPDVASPALKGNMLMNPISAIADAFSRGRFSFNFSQSYLRGLEIQRQEAQNQWDQAIENYQTHFLTYGKILSEASVTKNFDAAREAVRNYAIQTGDQDILRVLASGDLKAVEQHLNNQDALWRQLNAANTSMRKATGAESDAAERASMGLPPMVGGPNSGFNFQGLPGEGEPAPPAPGAVRTPTAADDTPVSKYDEYLSGKLGLTPEQARRSIDEARRKSLGLEAQRHLKPGGTSEAAVGEAERMMNNDVERVANIQEPPGSTRTPEQVSQEKQDLISEINPGYGNIIKGLHTLQIDPNSASMQKNERLHLIDITQRVWPGWNQGMYHNYWNTWANVNSKEGQQIQAANRVGTTVTSLEAAINNLPIPEDAALPTTLYNEIVNGTLGNNPRYNALNELLGAFARESMTTQTGRPGGAVSYVKQMMEKLDLRQGKAGLRAAVRASVSATRNLVDGMQQTYTQQTGRPPETMPGFLPRTQDVYDAVTMGNPFTGDFPKEAPLEIQEVSPKVLDPEGKYRKTRPSWMDKNMEWEPMSRKEFDKREKYIRDHPDDPMSNIYKHELGITR